MSDHTQPQNTFVVRFWWQLDREASNSATRWRGRVEHLQSGEGTTFHDAHQLLAFMHRFVISLEWQATGDASQALEDAGK